MKKDISNRKDIECLVDNFYEKVRLNKQIGYIFIDVAKVNWSVHLPKMYSFWASLLLDEQSYNENPTMKHIQLSKLTPLTSKEFEEWLLLFTQTVDEYFSGEIAEQAKVKAEGIAKFLLYKIQPDEQSQF
jgi:hemoglobin